MDKSEPKKPRKDVFLRVDEDLIKAIQHAQIDSEYRSVNDWFIAAAKEKLAREGKKK